MNITFSFLKSFIKKFHLNDYGGVVEYIMIVALSAIFALIVMPKTQVVSEDWFISNGQTIMQNIGGGTPFKNYISGSINSSSPPNFNKGVDGILKPNIAPTPATSFYIDANTLKSRAVSFTATPLSNGYKPIPPLFCKWTGYPGYSGTSCTPNVPVTFSLGNHSISVEMIDALGAKGSSSYQFTVGYQPVSFNLTLYPQQANNYESDQVVNIQASNLAGGVGKYNITWYLDGKKQSDTSTLFSQKFTAKAHTLSATICSPSSNCTTHSVNFTVSTSPPTEPSIVMTPTKNLYYNTHISFSVGNPSTDADGESFSYQWSTNDQNWSTSAPSGTFNVGSHTVYLRAVNVYQQVSPTSSLTFTIQSTPPKTPDVTVQTSNLSLNSGFESWDGKSALARGWSEEHSASKASFSVVTTPVHGGKYAEKIDASTLESNQSADIYQSLPATPNATFLASAYVEPSSLNHANVLVGVGFYDKYGQIIKTFTSAPVSSTKNSYQQLSISGSVPFGTATAKLFIEDYTNGSSGSAITYVDDASYTEHVDSSTIGSSTPTWWVGTTLNFAANATDPDGEAVHYTWDLNGNQTSFAPNGIFSTASDNNLKVTAINTSQLYSPTTTLPFDIINEAPYAPTLTLSPNPLTTVYYADTKISFSATAISPEGTKITNYQYKIDNGSWQSGPPNGTYSVGTHMVYVKAVDANNLSSPVTSQQFIVHEYPTPGEPGLHCTTGLSSLTCTLTPSPIANDPPIHYEVCTTDGSVCSNPTTSTTVTLSGFATNGETITVHAREENAYKWGSWTGDQSYTLTNPYPGTPSFTCSPGVTSITCDITASSTGRYGTLHFELCTSNNSNCITSTSSQIKLSGFSPNHEWVYLHARVENEYHWGSWTSVQQYQLLNATPSGPSFSCTTGITYITCNMSPSSTANYSPIYYNLCTSNNSVCSGFTTDTTITLSGFSAGSYIVLHAEEKNNYHTGSWSGNVGYQLNQPPTPGAPSLKNCWVNSNGTTIYCNINPNSSGNAGTMHYRLCFASGQYGGNTSEAGGYHATAYDPGYCGSESTSTNNLASYSINLVADSKQNNDDYYYLVYPEEINGYGKIGSGSSKLLSWNQGPLEWAATNYYRSNLSYSTIANAYCYVHGYGSAWNYETMTGTGLGNGVLLEVHSSTYYKFVTYSSWMSSHHFVKDVFCNP